MPHRYASLGLGIRLYIDHDRDYSSLQREVIESQKEKANRYNTIF